MQDKTEHTLISRIENGTDKLIEDLVAAVPADRILFGSDYPMLETSAHLARVLLADISDDAKMKILRDNAAAVYGIGKKKRVN